MSTARTGAALTGRLSQQGSRGGNGNHRPYVARYRSARAAQRRHRPRYGLGATALLVECEGGMSPARALARPRDLVTPFCWYNPDRPDPVATAVADALAPVVTSRRRYGA